MKEELKPSELRIGNWVMYDPNELIEDPFAEPIPQYPFRIESGERIDLSVYGGYHPIPITDEILKAVGAVDRRKNRWKIESFELEEREGLYYPTINIFEYTVSEGMKYLHQLQNMYYCLEGKELEVNLQSKEETKMKTFPTYDYTLCNTKECAKKESCVRDLTYRKAQEEKYPYRISVLYRKDAETECDLFVEAKEETRC